MLKKIFASPEAAESHYFPLKLVASEPQPAGVEPVHIGWTIRRTEVAFSEAAL